MRLARWRPEQLVAISAREVARANPWGGIPGCVYLGAAPRADEAGATFFVGGVRGLDDRLCQRADMRGIAPSNGQTPLALRLAGEPTPDMPVEDERWNVPPSLAVLLQPLETLHRPSGSLYRAYTEAGADAKATPTSYRYGPNRIAIGGKHISETGGARHRGRAFACRE